MAQRSERNKIRYALWRNMQDCDRMRQRVEEAVRMYIATGNDDYAAFVGGLQMPIKILAEAFERTRSQI